MRGFPSNLSELFLQSKIYIIKLRGKTWCELLLYSNKTAFQVFLGNFGRRDVAAFALEVEEAPESNKQSCLSSEHLY